MAPTPSLPLGAWAAAVFLTAVGLRVCALELGARWSAGCAFLALLAAAAGLWGAPRATLLVAAGALGIARAPVADRGIPPPPRPVVFHAEVVGAHRDGEDGWVGSLRRLRDTDGRPWSVRAARLSFRAPREPPRGAVRAAGLLAATPYGLSLGAAELVPLPDDGNGLLPRDLRGAVRRRLEERLPPEEAGFATALLLGERDGLPAEQHRAYRRLGLLHLLAISGMHLWLWDAMLRRVLRGRSGRLRTPLLVLTAALAGFGPAVTRALLAVLLRDALAHRGRRVRPELLWSTALWGELAVLPARDAGVGLLLSYSATAGILLAAGGPGGWRRTLRVSLAAACASAPWLHALQGTLEPWSVLLSPVLACLLPLRLTLAGAALVPGGEHLAAPLLGIVGSCERLLLMACDALPGTPWVTPDRPTAGVALVCALIVLGLRARRPAALGAAAVGAPASGTRRWAVPGLLALLATLFWPAGPPGVSVLPAGHGLAVVVAGEDRTLLFDFGSRSMTGYRLVDRVLLPELARRNGRAPDRVCLSHPDSDHRNGLPPLAELVAFETCAAGPGGFVELEGLTPWSARLLGCAPPAPGAPNLGGQVLELRAGARRLVLIGDQFGHPLRALRQRLAPGPIDVLLLPHHGRSTDGLAELLEHLLPRVAWASCAEDARSLPAEALLRHRGIPLFTTRSGHGLRFEAQRGFRPERHDAAAE